MITHFPVNSYPQNTQPPVRICQVEATSETGSEVTYSLASEFFSIDPNTGEITTKAVLDYEIPTQRQFMVCIPVVMLTQMSLSLESFIAIGLS